MLSVGASARSQQPIRINAAEVDHGSATTTATASQSATRSSRARSKARDETRVRGVGHRRVLRARRYATFWRLRATTV